MLYNGNEYGKTGFGMRSHSAADQLQRGSAQYARKFGAAGCTE